MLLSLLVPLVVFILNGNSCLSIVLVVFSIKNVLSTGILFFQRSVFSTSASTQQSDMDSEVDHYIKKNV